MNMKPIFDNGHGGMINGSYQTPGKRSPEWGHGILYEGMFNRWVINRLIEKCDRQGIPYFHASPELKDVSLKERVDRSNEFYKNDKDVYLLSIHANAGGGTGIEGFTSEGETKSDIISECFLNDLENQVGSTEKMRFDLSDGDKDKESNFYVLRKTNCPAFLLECGFMDNRNDYQKLWNENHLQSLVDTIFKTIKYLYNEKPI